MHRDHEPIVSKATERFVARPRGFGRRPHGPRPPTEAEMARARAMAFERPSPVMRRVKWAGVWLGIILLALFAKFSVNGILDRLPTCESDEARNAVVGMVRRKLIEKKISFTRVDIRGAQTSSSGESTWACRAEVYVDGERALAIEYDISWTARLISRYEVEMRPARN